MKKSFNLNAFGLLRHRSTLAEWTCTERSRSGRSQLLFFLLLCLAKTSFAVFTVNAWVTNNVSCFGANNGSAIAMPSGGGGTYTYSWSNGQTSQSATNLSPGTYMVTVTNVFGGGTISKTVTVYGPSSPLSISISGQIDAQCNGGFGSATVNASGGATPGYSVLHHFFDNSYSSAGLHEGYNPIGNSLLVLGNTLYGMTTKGGDNNFIPLTGNYTEGDGTVFRINADGSNFIKMFDHGNGNDGAKPNGSLAVSPDGEMLYGMTKTEGANGKGTVFCVNTSGTFYQKLFDIPATGTNPIGSVAVWLGSRLYGFMPGNGGSIFWCNADGSGGINILRTFPGPQRLVGSPLIIGDTLYGLTFAGGTSNLGTVFKTHVNGGGYSEIVNFNGANGRDPEDQLSLVVSGNTLYGIVRGGTGSNGVVFSVKKDGTAFTVLQQMSDGIGDGDIHGSMVLGGNTLYGIKSQGGTYNDGYIFSVLATGGGYRNLYSLNEGGASNDGSLPYGYLTNSGSTSNWSGVLYGLNSEGGTNNKGTIFRYISEYKYLWMPGGQTTKTVTNLTAGTHTVYVTDAYGCTVSTTVTITEPATAITGSTSVTDVLCNGGNGSATVTASGGTGTLTFSWSPGGQTTPTVVKPAGTHTVTIKDANNCTLIKTATISQPATPLSATISGSNIVCYGNTSNISLSPAGGTTSYTYSWSPGGQTTQNISVTTGGTYSVVITDANNCTLTKNITITSPSNPLGGDINYPPVQCNGGTTTATLVIHYGTAPFNWTWSTGASNVPSVSVPAGSYNVTVTDANSCTFTKGFYVPQPGAFNITMASHTNVSCNGANTGNALANPATGGYTPYTNLIDFNGANPYAAMTLSGGKLYGMIYNAGANNKGLIYSVNADGTGFTNLMDFNGNNGANPYNNSLLIVGNTMYGMTLFGGANDLGCIFSIQTNGTGYTKLLDFNGTNGAKPNGTLVLSGNKLFGVTSEGGANNAGRIFSINIDGTGYTNLLDFNGTNGSNPYGSLTLWGTTLYGMTSIGGTTGKGTIFSINTNGTGYTKLLDFNGTNGENPYGTTLALSGTTLYGMTYVGGSNNQGCIFSIATNGTAYTKLLDFNGTNGSNPYGSLTLSGTTLYGMTTNGGTSGVGCIFSINTNGTGYLNRQNFNNTNGANPRGDVILWGNTIYGVTPLGGALGAGIIFRLNPNYTYNWTPTGGTNLSASNLSAGTYTITASDGQGCTAYANVTITQPTAITGTITTTTVTCNGGNNGSATVTGAGGTGPGTYSYTWSPGGQTTQTATNLSAGNYTVTIKDGNNCTGTATVTVTQPAAITGTFATIQPTCFGGNDGALTVTPANGTAPYTYTWTPGGQTTQTATNIIAGNYTITIKDINNCVANASVTLTQPAAITGTFTTIQPSCNGGNNGSATVTAINGTAPYTYTWVPGGQTTVTATNLTAGNYTVTIKDVNNCTGSPNVTVTQPAVITGTFTTTQPACNGGNNGSATVTPSGGIGAYTYSWSPTGQTTQTATNLSAGNYSVTIKDINNCTGIANTTITQPAVLAGSISTPPVCSGVTLFSATANPSGGTSPYTYTWSPGGQTTQTASNLSAGSYTVNIKDSKNCTASASISLSAPAPLAISIASYSNVSCNGYNNGTATANAATGGTAPYAYSWIPSGITTLTATGLSPGIHSVKVTDANSCTATSATIAITQPPALTVTVTKNDPACNYTLGDATAHPTGGTGPYTYAWSDGQTTQTATNLPGSNTGCCGTYYNVIVTDANGCSITSQCSIFLPSEMKASTPNHVDASCDTCHNGSALAYEPDIWLGWGGHPGIAKKIHSCTSTLETHQSTGALVAAGNKLYGYMGGDLNYWDNGRIFSMNTDGTGYTILHEFDGSCGCNEGYAITGDLMISAAGDKLYGMSTYGGDYGAGTIFSMNLDGTGYMIIHSFDGAGDGGASSATLVQPNGGNLLYGTTDFGGTGGYGILFKINTDGSNFTKLFDFGGANGKTPCGKLLVDGSAVYGLTTRGGNYGYGVIYRYDWSSSTFTKLHDFGANLGAYYDGMFPTGSLILSTHYFGYTILVGTTTRGGTSDYGTLFNIKPDGSAYSLSMHFASTNFRNPCGSLIKVGPYSFLTAKNGGKYGFGGILNAGQYTVGASEFVSFKGSEGMFPIGTLVALPNANNSFSLFGVSTSGDTSAGYGTIFEAHMYDYSWAPSGGNTVNATGLSPGTYTVTVTDGYGCILQKTVAIGPTPSTGLPIELVNFDAVPNNEDADLSWVTASEINNEHFTLQRSLDGVNWRDVSNIKGAGNSTQTLYYKYKDVNAAKEVNNNGIIYYRLSQTDFDKTTKYSEIKAVEFNKDASAFEVYPNPVKQDIFIKLKTKEAVQFVEIINSLGQVVYRSNKIEEEGISTKGFTEGIYVVFITTGEKTYQQKFIKEK